MILITGASGMAGKAVLDAARAMHLPVRAMYRNAADEAAAPEGVATVIADYADPASLVGALDGIDIVYLVCGPVPQLVALEGAMIDACMASGIRHVVLNSALGAGRFNKAFPAWHTQVEAKLKTSGLAFTIIRPNGFMQNIATYNAATIRSDKAFYAAMGEARTSLIDVRDIGAVIARILSEPERHAERIYELNGPEALTNGEIAALLSRVLGTTVAFVDIPESAHRQAMLDAGMPDWQVTAILELQEYYRSGACATVDGTVERLTGRPVRRLDAYLAENAAVFRAPAVA